MACLAVARGPRPPSPKWASARQPSLASRAKAGAAGENRTHDLSLTKGLRYHYATAASKVVRAGKRPGAEAIAQPNAKAKGMTKVARDTGLSRESLYKSLSGTTKPEFDTVRKVIGSFGLKLVAEPIDTKAA